MSEGKASPFVQEDFPFEFHGGHRHTRDLPLGQGQGEEVDQLEEQVVEVVEGEVVVGVRLLHDPVEAL